MFTTLLIIPLRIAVENGKIDEELRKALMVKE